MSIATIKAVINDQTYTLTLAEDGYYTLSGTAPALFRQFAGRLLWRTDYRY